MSRKKLLRAKAPQAFAKFSFCPIQFHRETLPHEEGSKSNETGNRPWAPNRQTDHCLCRSRSHRFGQPALPLGKARGKRIDEKKSCGCFFHKGIGHPSPPDGTFGGGASPTGDFRVNSAQAYQGSNRRKGEGKN